VIHIAGTKGQGSTAAMIANGLKCSGLKVGFYTSPHLQDFNERIQVDGQPISNQTFVELVEEIRPQLSRFGQPPTFFEITTAMAFLYFSRHQTDAAVIEVGLGGRLDSTNVVTPLVSVITSLSMDHMAVLGDTLAKIAAEKAGIIKPGRPVVCSPQLDETARVVAQTAAARGARLVQIGQDYRFTADEHSLDGQTFLVWRNDDQAQIDRYLEGLEPLQSACKYEIPLLGYHQIQNAVTAYAALQVAREEGLAVTEEGIRTGFQTAVWPGRFEILQRSPLLVIDSAHNRDSALRLRLTLDDYLPAKPVILVYGASEDKDIPGMFSELLPRVKRMVATQSVHPRAANADNLVTLAHKYGTPARAVVPVEKALELALELAEQEDAAVVAAGSLFIAAAVRTVWQERGLPARPLGNG
jgi:dihydrofolate synthase/folylpolyglutamate synthase